MKIVCIADLHSQLIDIPECDILLIAGDITPCRPGDENWLNGKFRRWLDRIPAKNVVSIAGNHDRIWYESKYLVPKDLRMTYLEDELVEIEGLKIYGTPWTPTYLNWYFMKDPSELYEIWDNIPNDIDILLSHGPPYGILDQPLPESESHLGSVILRYVIDKIKPSYCVFGHIHGSGGKKIELNVKRKNIQFVNSSILDEDYKVKNKPVIIEV